MSGKISIIGAKSGITGKTNVSPSEISIDSLGGVSFPKNPAFRGNRNTSVRVNYDAYGIVAMNDEAYDVDNSYDMTTGKFTAKVAGRYIAHGQFQVNVGGITSNHASCQINKNSANQDGFYFSSEGIRGNGTGPSSPGGGTVFELAVGDTIEMGGASTWNNASSTTYGDASLNATTFSVSKVA